MTYRVSLRREIVAAVDAGMPHAEASRLFRVSLATVERYIRQWHETGNFDPRPLPGRPKVIAPTDLPVLAAQLAAHPHATITEHCQLWERATGKRPYRVTMGRAIRELGWSRRSSR